MIFGKNRSMDHLNFDLKCVNLPYAIAKSLENYLKMPAEGLIFLFVGSDSNIGDSLAPLCGTIFSKKVQNAFNYGGLGRIIGAKEVPYAISFIEKCHPSTKIVVIDAAVGKKEDVGMIKVQNVGIKPGLGANKNLPKVGDLSVIGILGEKRADGRTFTASRLSQVYKMAENIANGLIIFVKNNEKRLNLLKKV